MMWNNPIEQELNIFRSELKKIKEKLNQLPVPFKMMYRPPGEDVHWNVVEYLDNVDKRLRRLEEINGITDRS